MLVAYPETLRGVARIAPYLGEAARKNMHSSYYRARYYDSQVGRFISEDPIGFRGGIDLYAYVGNNPIDLRDPRGLIAASPSSGGCSPKRDCKKEYDDCRKNALNDYNTCMNNAFNAFKRRSLICAAESAIPWIGPGLSAICNKSANDALAKDEVSCGSAVSTRLANCLARKTLCELGL